MRQGEYVMKERERERITVYFPAWARKERLSERLEKLAQDRRRTISFLAADAILRYVQAEEKKS